MGHLKDIANQPKLHTFPSSTFEIAGEVPTSQCTEALLQGDNAETKFIPNFTLIDFFAFEGFDLTGKICTITASVGGNTGDFDIVQNIDHSLILVQNPGQGQPVAYYIHNGGELILTRNVQSFAEFIHTTGYAYTIKGGKLYTNIPSAQLQPACSILFNPLT